MHASAPERRGTSCSKADFLTENPFPSWLVPEEGWWQLLQHPIRANRCLRPVSNQSSYDCCAPIVPQTRETPEHVGQEANPTDL